MKKDLIVVDSFAIKEALLKKNMKANELAEQLGMDQSTFSKKQNGRISFSRLEMNYMCMILGVDEDYLTKKPEVVKVATEVENVLNSNEIMNVITEIKQGQAKLYEDMIRIAKIVAEIQKASYETKAQCELIADDISGLQKKCFDISSTVNKISGWLNAKYRASKS